MSDKQSKPPEGALFIDLNNSITGQIDDQPPEPVTVAAVDTGGRTPFRYLVFDIESIPNVPLLRQTHPHIPATATDKEVVDAYNKTQSDEKGHAVDFIPAGFQLPLVVGYLRATSECDIIDLGVYDAPTCRPKEGTAAFWADMALAKEYVMFHGRKFDIPVLELQALEDGVTTPGWYSRSGATYLHPRNRAYSNGMDLCDILGNFGAHGVAGGLDALAKRIGCPGKMDVDGSMVWRFYREGKLAQIIDYCMCDVLDTYWLMVRYLRVCGTVTVDRERTLRHDIKLWLKTRSSLALAQYADRLQPIP